MFWQVKRDFSDAKRMSERRRRDRSICLACKVFICVSRQKEDDLIRKWHNPTKQSNSFVSPKSKEDICLL